MNINNNPSYFEVHRDTRVLTHTLNHPEVEWLSRAYQKLVVKCHHH